MKDHQMIFDLSANPAKLGVITYILNFKFHVQNDVFVFHFILELFSSSFNKNLK